MRRAVRGGLWAATIVASSVRLAGQSPPDAVEAEVAGRRALLEVARHHAFPAIDASDLTQLWGGVTRRGVFLRAHVLGDELAFEAGSPFFRHGDRTYQLVNPPYEWGGAFWLPAEFVTGWLAEHGSPVAVAPESLPAGDEALPDRVDPAKPWHVVIDPGHGGRDPGTSGRQSNEKDVVLGIGRRLYEELQRRDLIEPYLTRDTDVYVKHDLRSQFAVDQGGDLFVSIHANWASDARATGFETIFLGPARSEEAREVALRENRGPSVEDAVGSPADIQFILTGLDRTENLAQSRLFGGFVQNALRDARGGNATDRGVKQGPWWVLLGALARMPSVIVEVGFLSNQNEERYLSGDQGQRELARAIADAIVEYRRDVLRRYATAEPREPN